MAGKKAAVAVKGELDELVNGWKPFILAPTTSVVEGGEPVASFVAIPCKTVEDLRKVVAPVLAELVAKKAGYFPQVSFNVGAHIAMSYEAAAEIVGEEDPPEEAVVVSMDPKFEDPSHSRDAETVRLVFHEDGDVWAHVLPKYGDAYEAELTLRGEP